MKITIPDKKLKKLCEEPSVAQKKLGAKAAEKLKSRLADLSAAQAVTELVAGRPHPVQPNKLGKSFYQKFYNFEHLFALDLNGGLRLVFQADVEPLPLKADESLDWSKVNQICIVFVGDYHD
ncbi:MAG: killer suppression protein HigA [Moorea sp. SIO4G2]|nr:killer suppression protein HigA [Moorena sp. SIO4A3]NEO66022.1 killer suppression protein HigA [Moorena sp. SIO4G2]NEQ78893.1 killer suppression protein HigA [Moorena sp. SIO2I5]